MRAWRRWLIVLLAGASVAGGLTAWRLEAAASVAPSEPAGLSAHAVTPVLSVRRLPTVVAGPVAARRLRADLDGLVPLLPLDSCLVVEGPDQLRYDHRGDVGLVPASTEKLLTAAAALGALPSETRFRTSVVAPPFKAGIVPGDLTLVGGGDPLLATADYVARFQRQPQVFTDLDALAAAVQAAGVLRIEGSVVGDESRYDRARYVDGWSPSYIADGEIGPLSALALNDGFERYPTKPGGGDPLDAAADPAANAAAVLTRLLEARGVDVLGDPRSGTSPAGAIEVAAVESVPILEVVGTMLRESDNSTAELLIKELGRAAGQPTTAAGVTSLRSLLDQRDLDLTGAVQVDGSGLSLDDRVTCSLLVDVLRQPGTGPAIVDTLAVAGQSGTLAKRFVGTVLDGVLRAKTGSLTSVTALAGVVADEDPALTFALVVNVPPPASVPTGVAELQQRVAEVLAGWPRVAGAVVLGPQGQDG